METDQIMEPMSDGRMFDSGIIGQTVIGEDSNNEAEDDSDDSSEIDNDDEDDRDGVDQENGNTDEESIADEGGGDDEDDQEDDQDEESSMSEDDGHPKPTTHYDNAESGEEGEADAEGRMVTSDYRSEEPISTEVSPQNEVQKRGRGRPKKILRDSDILDALDESYHSKPKRLKKGDENESDNNDDGSASESEEEEEEEDDVKNNIVEDENIRRSGRERKAPRKFEAVIPQKKKKKKRSYSSESDQPEEDDDSDYYNSKKKKKSKNKKSRDKFGIYKKSSPTKATKIKRKQKKPVSEDEDEDGDNSDGSDNDYSKSWKNKMKKNKKKGKITAADFGGDKKSSRARKTTKYEEEDTSHSSDVASDYDPEEAEAQAAEEEDLETIENILDNRRGKVGATGNATMFWAVKDDGDPNLSLDTEDTEEQFYIKWKGWSHINNTWESQTSLDAKKKGNLEVKGIRKLFNYQQKLGEYNSWKKFATPEDVEYQEVEKEMQRQLLWTYTEVERIISHRRNESNTNDYFVKWKNLTYADSTWEDESVMKSYYSEPLEEYNTRKKLKCNPRSYKESMKFFKKTFRPLKEQPSFIGSEELRLRDYQMDGLNFMLKAWHNGDSLILADEMGLGKTIQSISFLKYLFHVYPFKGPMLVVVPLSTMAAWQKEFSVWAPELNTICYNGSMESRQIIRTHELENSSGELIFNALLTNYEMVCKDRTFFQDIIWSNIVVDEAHR